MDTLTNRTFKRFEKAVDSLARAAHLGTLPDNAERDALLLRFELAAELMPKVLKRILSDRGASVALPKDAVRAARGADMMREEIALMLLQIIEDRNRMVHDYSEEYAVELAQKIRASYLSALQELISALQKNTSYENPTAGGNKRE